MKLVTLEFTDAATSSADMSHHANKQHILETFRAAAHQLNECNNRTLNVFMMKDSELSKVLYSIAPIPGVFITTVDVAKDAEPVSIDNT